MLTYTWLQFEADTAKTGNVVGRARGSNLAKVDDTLNDYELRIGAANAQLTLVLLRAIVMACKEWLKVKKTKNEFTKNGFGQRTNYVNPLFLKRKTAVGKLANAALDELFIQLQAQGLLTPDERGEITFNKHKFTTQGTRKGYQTAVKPLDEGYTFERTSYVKSGKNQAIAGSGIHRTQASFQALHRDNHTDQIGLPNTVLPKNIVKMRQQVVTIANKNINALSLKDLAMLDEIGRVNMLSGNVDYLKKAERYRYMAIPDNAGSLCDYNDNPLNFPAWQVIAYAMDKYGNLFCKDAVPIAQTSEFFNHSSFNTGHDVICAGCLAITNGALLMIDNNSGHYKPTRDHLHNCIKVLDDEGVDLTNTEVELHVFVWNALQAKHIEHVHKFHAAAFLADKNSIPHTVI